MTDLSTSWLGIPLRTPLVAGPSPLGHDIEGVVRLAECGASAIVLPSLFEEQITHEALQFHHVLEGGAGEFAEAAEGYFPALDDYNAGPDRYLTLIASARAQVDVPIVASINCTHVGEWTRYARWVEDAGAHAVELNMYEPSTDPERGAGEVEADYVEVVRAVRAATRLPLSVKLTPYVTSLPHLARALTDAGAQGLVLFNRLYHPDVDLDALRVVPRLILSRPAELALPLRWTGILHGRVECDLAVTGGVHDGESAVKAILVGAGVVMLASALLRHGPEHLRGIEQSLRAWMTERDYADVAQMRGSVSRTTSRDPAAFERGNYLTALTTWSSEAPAARRD